MADKHPELPAKEKERIKRREKKRRPKMGISGRSILTLARIIREKARGERPLKSGRGKRRKKKRKKR